MTPKYPYVVVELAGRDGNAFAIMGRVANAMRRAGVPQDKIDEYFEESKKGDYHELIETAFRWVDCH